MFIFANNMQQNSNEKQKSIISYPISIGIALVIWLACMIPVPETPLNDVNLIDKWTHFVMYGTLTFSLWHEYRRIHKILPLHNGIKGGFVCIVCPIAMGGAVELAQAYLTTCRSGDWFDFVCNTIGVVVGCLLYKLFSVLYH